jgi:diketogulonate reductase-like aldo/keto reductase
MRFRRFGPTRYEVPVIGQGTWGIDEGRRELAVAALRRGLDEGMTHIDTAEMYGDAELLIAEAISGRRDEVFLVSKVLPHNASTKGVIEACERSLSRLRTDRLDCYLLHWRGRIPLHETFAGFEQLVRSGKILAWGVSNFDAADLDDAQRVAGPGRIACNQVLYHLEERAIEHEVIPRCNRYGAAVVGYAPFGHGRFPDEHSPGGSVLAEIAAAHDATPRQIALACLARLAFVIPKASTPEHAAENAGAGDISLTESELARIDAAFPPRPETRSPADDLAADAPGDVDRHAVAWAPPEELTIVIAPVRFPPEHRWDGTTRSCRFSRALRAPLAQGKTQIQEHHFPPTSPALPVALTG